MGYGTVCGVPQVLVAECGGLSALAAAEATGNDEITPR